MERITIETEEKKFDEALQTELDSLMQQGYDLLAKGDETGAADVWLQLWSRTLEVMKDCKFASIEELDQHFHGLQSYYNWSTYLDTTLANAGRQNAAYYRNSITFHTQYLECSREQADWNNLERKRSIAEAYFALGEITAGEALFEKELEANPTWGWGWIGWSDQYGLFVPKEQAKDTDKAIAILQRALEIEGLEDRFDVLDRLASLYEEAGNKAEANRYRKLAQEEEAREKARPLGSTFSLSGTSGASTRSSVSSTKSVKIGRNDPCPCGSGKKYKKCCGQ